jgi:2-polyprenyl-3-methyl-5-hydroxy-6-metoxy-1,4-benzoquinol methylase
LKILDLGCGDGLFLSELIQVRKNLKCFGIDMSKTNINFALLRFSDGDNQLSYSQGDYMNYKEKDFDVIISFSTLHLIDRNNEIIFRKISNDLKKGGMLVFSSPSNCFYNIILIKLKIFLRMIRSASLDQFAYVVAKLLYGQKMQNRMIKERIKYLYITPNFLVGRKFLEKLKFKYKLELIDSLRFPHLSIMQPKHVTFVLKKV